MIDSSWKQKESAGGSLVIDKKRNPQFYANPQYRLTVVDPDENDEDNTGFLILIFALFSSFTICFKLSFSFIIIIIHMYFL